jgi:hypothetical protein
VNVTEHYKQQTPIAITWRTAKTDIHLTRPDAHPKMLLNITNENLEITVTTKKNRFLKQYLHD